MNSNSWRYRLLSTTALTRRWRDDPMTLAGDCFLTGNAILLTRGGYGLNVFDMSAAILFFGAAGTFAMYGNDKFLSRVAMGCGAAAMGVLWGGAKILQKEGADSVIDQIGKGLYIFSQLFGIFVPGYTPSEQHRTAWKKLYDAVMARPLRTMGVLALLSKTPMIIATMQNLQKPNEALNAGMFLAVLACWNAGDIATLRAGQLQDRAVKTLLAAQQHRRPPR